MINNEAFRKFIGLYEEDPLEVQIFEAAFKATKYELCIWDDIKYDDPISALSKLLVRKIWKNVKMDIYAEVPKGESTRKASLKLAYKIITGVIEKAVPAAWNQAYDSSRKVREINQKMLDRVIELIIEKKKDINYEIKKKIIDLFELIRSSLDILFSKALHKVIPPIIKPFAFIYKTYSEKAEQNIIQALYSCDKNLIKEGINLLNNIHQKIIVYLKDKVDELLQTIWKELQGVITIRLLTDLFNPMKAIGRILADFVNIINPENFSSIVIELFEYKNQLSICNGQGIEKILNEMERYIY